MATQYTFTSGSVNRSTFQALPFSGPDTPTGAREGMPSALRFIVEMTVAAATATLEVVITKNRGGTEAIKYTEIATVTAGSQRTGFDGASGNYGATVVFARSLNDFFDPTGYVDDGTCRILAGPTTISSGNLLLEVAGTRKT